MARSVGSKCVGGRSAIIRARDGSPGIYQVPGSRTGALQ